VIKGNAGQFGFYRVNYDDQGWKNLMKVLSINHTVSITPYHPLIRTCEARVRDHGACALNLVEDSWGNRNKNNIYHLKICLFISSKSFYSNRSKHFNIGRQITAHAPLREGNRDF